MRIDGRELAAIFAGGFAGAVLRAVVGDVVPHDPGSWPWATFAVNVAGAALLVWLTGRPWLSAYWRPLVGTGFCGALTTFSTMQLELLDMLDTGRAGLALVYAVASIGVGLLAVTAATHAVRRA